ncbi:hypothetical protein EV426DRAFT_701898 [Tirmania nivea]|nr:hypothetical protein EV426DRAFT_701898 [Tirmania nivea]
MANPLARFAIETRSGQIPIPGNTLDEALDFMENVGDIGIIVDRDGIRPRSIAREIGRMMPENDIFNIARGLPGGFLWRVGPVIESARTTAFTTGAALLPAGFPTLSADFSTYPRPPGILRVQESHDLPVLLCATKVEVRDNDGCHYFKIGGNCCYDTGMSITTLYAPHLYTISATDQVYFTQMVGVNGDQSLCLSTERQLAFLALEPGYGDSPTLTIKVQLPLYSLGVIIRLFANLLANLDHGRLNDYLLSKLPDHMKADADTKTSQWQAAGFPLPPPADVASYLKLIGIADVSNFPHDAVRKVRVVYGREKKPQFRRKLRVPTIPCPVYINSFCFLQYGFKSTLSITPAVCVEGI